MTKPSPSASSTTTPHTTPQFYRISSRDLTEIELHSVESINDLHRTHPEHSHKVFRPPRPSPLTPSQNGNLNLRNPTAVSQLGHPMRGGWQSQLHDMFMPSSMCGYTVGCTVISLLLLTVLLMIIFLVQQGSALQSLTGAVQQGQAVAMEMTQLIEELHALRHNLTNMKGGH